MGRHTAPHRNEISTFVVKIKASGSGENLFVEAAGERINNCIQLNKPNVKTKVVVSIINVLFTSNKATMFVVFHVKHYKILQHLLTTTKINP